MSEHRRFDLRRQHDVGEEGRLVPLLAQAQAEDGYLTRERMVRIHEETGAPLASIYGVATFYAQFRMQPIGKNLVRVCHGTACHVSGADDISRTVEDALGIADGETTPDRAFTLNTVACLGCCSLAPVVMINEATYANLSPKEIRRVLRGYENRGAGDAPPDSAPRGPDPAGGSSVPPRPEGKASP